MQQGAQDIPDRRGPGFSLGAVRIRWQAVAIVIVVAALLLSRLWALDNRSYSHDESIHAWESWKLVTGQRYVQDPVYHGPFLYHITALIYLLFGVNDTTARLGAALFAVAAVLLVWPLRRWLGRAGAFWAMLLLTLSPTMMFRGRFIRHDIFVIVPTMVMVNCFFRYVEDRQTKWLYIIAAALSLSFCAKANAFINGAIFGSFWVIYLLVGWVRSRKPLREVPAFDLVMLLATLALPLASPVLVKAMGFDPMDYSQTGLLRTLMVVVTMLSFSAVLGTWWNDRVWLVSAGIYYGIFFLLYTSMFANPQGAATGIVGMLGYWLLTQQAVARGGQPWYYYYFLLVVYELLPLLLSALGAIYYLVRRGQRGSDEHLQGAPAPPADDVERNPFIPFMVYWAFLNLVMFAWTAEKMPWQMQHIVLPLGLLGGWFLGRVWNSPVWRRLRSRGLLPTALWLGVAMLSLLVAVAGLGGAGRPFQGMRLPELAATMRWLLAVLVTFAGALLCLRYGRSLGRKGWVRLCFALVLVLMVGATLRTALRLSFVNQDYATEFLVYAASTPDTGRVIRELDDISARVAGDKELRVAYDNESQQPYFWYLRDYKNVSFFAEGGTPASDAQAIIVGLGNDSKIKSQLLGKYLRREYRLIWWPNQDVYSNLTPGKLWRDLRDASRRQYWWDILWNRKYPQDTTFWPYVSRFAFYVRKDIAAQLWDYGPEVAGSGIELPQDEYEQQRVQAWALASWGTQGSGPGQLEYPKDVALGPDGNVYVADTYNHRVQVFDSEGRFLRGWGGSGGTPGQFQEPWGIAVDQEGYVYVADTWNHRIQKFDAQGQFVRQWGVFGDIGGSLGDSALLYGPRDVVVDQEGNVIVSDTGNKRLLRFSADGQFLQQAGGGGTLNGQLREPVGLAVDGAGNVYVADTWNTRVQQFDAGLNWVAQWPVVGWEGEGVSNKPYLAADAQGNIYATAPDFHWIVKFSPAGEVLAVWGRYGSDLASFNMPSGVAIGEDRLYVADSANHRVLVFALLP